MNWVRWIGAVLVVALSVAAWAIRARSDDRFTRIEGRTFGTNYAITWQRGPEPEEVREAIERELDRIDSIASNWNSESELMRYQRTPDPDAFPMSPDLAHLLERSEEIEQWTGGAFSIRATPGQLDLSAIAKGYAVDRLVELLTGEFGIGDCLVDIGGEIAARGDGPAGPGWRVAIFSPDADGSAHPIRLENASIATSGNTFKPRHLIDPHTGRPVTHDLFSVSVIHPTTTTADALATALFVMGQDKGTAWAEEQGLRVIFIEADAPKTGAPASVPGAPASAGR